MTPYIVVGRCSVDWGAGSLGVSGPKAAIELGVKTRQPVSAATCSTFTRPSMLILVRPERILLGGSRQDRGQVEDVGGAETPHLGAPERVQVEAVQPLGRGRADAQETGSRMSVGRIMSGPVAVPEAAEASSVPIWPAAPVMRMRFIAGVWARLPLNRDHGLGKPCVPPAGT